MWMPRSMLCFAEWETEKKALVISISVQLAFAVSLLPSQASYRFQGEHT